MRRDFALFCIGFLSLSIQACGGSAAPPSDNAAEKATEYPVAAFFKTARFEGSSFSHDGSRVLVSSNETGVFNAWSIAAEGGAARQLTSSSGDAIIAVSYFPDDDRFLYSKDQAGNERSHLYVQSPDGSTRDITPGEKLKASFHSWSNDGKSFFVSSNVRDPKLFDLYEYQVADLQGELFFKNEGGYDLGPISPDKRYIALSRYKTTDDSETFLYDRNTKNTTALSPHQGVELNTPTSFSPDSKRLLFTSNAGRDFAALYSYEISGGARQILVEEPWDVTGAEYSRSGRYLKLFVNEDSRRALRLYDAASMTRVERFPLPAGAIEQVELSSDDKKMAIYATDGSAPEELYLGAADGPKQRLTDSLRGVVDRSQLVPGKVVRFSSYDGVPIPGVLLVPRQASAGKPCPAVVLVHGGPGGQSTIGFVPFVQALVNHGYVVYAINNRGSSGYGKAFHAMDDRKHGEADLGDVVASKQMLIDTGVVDPKRIGIVGGSYGGFMVLAALTMKPEEFKVGVDFFGVANWVRTLESFPSWWGAYREALYAELGDPKIDAERLRRISPLFHADKIKVPLMVLQGEQDPRVLKVESDEIVAAAKKNGVPVEYIVFPDEGHGFLKRDNEIKANESMLAFLDRYL